MSPTRREFIIMGGRLAGAAGLVGCQGASSSESSKPIQTPPAPEPNAPPPEAAAQAVIAAEPKDSCAPTIEQIAGPFAGEAHERSKFDLYGHAGVPFTLSGRVVDSKCRPIPGAQVLLWHATPSPPGVQPASMRPDPGYKSALYDHEAERGKQTPDGRTVPTPERMYYGWVRTNAEGHYAFSSLRPGWYLNGSVYRTSHLHIRVYVAEALRITTQLYFPDDPFNDADGIYADCALQGDCLMLPTANNQLGFDLVVA